MDINDKKILESTIDIKELTKRLRADGRWSILLADDTMVEAQARCEIKNDMASGASLSVPGGAVVRYTEIGAGRVACQIFNISVGMPMFPTSCAVEVDTDEQSA